MGEVERGRSVDGPTSRHRSRAPIRTIKSLVRKSRMETGDETTRRSVNSLIMRGLSEQIYNGAIKNMNMERELLRRRDLLAADHRREVREILGAKFSPVRIKGKGTIRLESIKSVQSRERRRAIRMVRKKIRKLEAKNRGGDSPTLAQAKKRTDWPKFKEAIDLEYGQMTDDEVYELHTADRLLPPGANLIGSMIILEIKRNTATGEIEKYKARLVALGNQQQPSSYDNIKSGTARSASVKMLISIQAKTLGAVSMVMDVKGAYLKSVLRDTKNEQLYLKLPNGDIVRLKKYLYGLKQAGYEWECNVTDCLTKLGYEQSETDPLIFSMRDGSDFIIMCLHVDDFYVVSTQEEWIRVLHKALTDKYGVVTLKEGDLLSYLGLKIEHNIEQNTMDVNQPVFARKLVKEFLTSEMMSSKRVFRTPMSAVEKSRPDDDVPTDRLEYMRMVGGLNYLSQYTRPDMLYVVSRCAQACSRPTRKDVRRMIRAFLYLRDTLDVGLSFHVGNVELVCYVDASYNSYSDGRGHYGYTFALGPDDASFFARSKKASLTALSSTEAEYIALCEATRDAIWLRRLLRDIGFKQRQPTLMWQDNMSTIDMVNGHRSHRASKHINPKFHFTGEMVERGEIVLRHKSTDMMVADVLTKALHAEDHVRLANLLLA